MSGNKTEIEPPSLIDRQKHIALQTVEFTKWKPRRKDLTLIAMK